MGWQHAERDVELRKEKQKLLRSVMCVGKSKKPPKRKISASIKLEKTCYHEAKTREEYTNDTTFLMLLQRVLAECAKRRSRSNSHSQAEQEKKLIVTNVASKSSSLKKRSAFASELQILNPLKVKITKLEPLEHSNVDSMPLNCDPLCIGSSELASKAYSANIPRSSSMDTEKNSENESVTPHDSSTNTKEVLPAKRNYQGLFQPNQQVYLPNHAKLEPTNFTKNFQFSAFYPDIGIPDSNPNWNRVSFYGQDHWCNSRG